MMKVYAVGGFIRDRLMNQNPTDYDFVVVGATPEQMLMKGFKQVGADFPVFLHPRTKEEWALARTERKIGHGYHGFEVEFDPGVTLEEDLYRRDFTINAMAREVLNPEEDDVILDSVLVDPFNGKDDIEEGIIRHVSDHFSEDPVRALRAARFAARYGFTVAPLTVDLIHSMKESGELDHLTEERVWLEFEKAVKERCIGSFLRTLREMEILKTVYPDILTADFYGLCRTLNNTDGIDEALTVITSYIVEPYKLLENRLIPTKTRQFVKKYHDLVYEMYNASKQIVVSGEQIIEMFNSLDAFRDRTFLYKAMKASCCFDVEKTTNKIIDLYVYHNIAGNIGYEHLTDDQKETLSGVEIGNAINSLRVQAINEALSS